jgi:hypothetical protein
MEIEEYENYENYTEYIKRRSISFGMFNNPIKIITDEETGLTRIEIIYCGNRSERFNRYLNFLNKETENQRLKYLLERPTQTNYAGRQFSWFRLYIDLKLP